MMPARSRIPVVLAMSSSVAPLRFGAALANAGDTNALGWDDLLIGAYGDDSAYLWRGGGL